MCSIETNRGKRRNREGSVSLSASPEILVRYCNDGREERWNRRRRKRRNTSREGSKGSLSLSSHYYFPSQLLSISCRLHLSKGIKRNEEWKKSPQLEHTTRTPTGCKSERSSLVEEKNHHRSSPFIQVKDTEEHIIHYFDYITFIQVLSLLTIARCIFPFDFRTHKMHQEQELSQRKIILPFCQSL